MIFINNVIKNKLINVQRGSLLKWQKCIITEMQMQRY